MAQIDVSEYSYEEALKYDLIGHIRPLLESGRLLIEEDGLIAQRSLCSPPKPLAPPDTAPPDTADFRALWDKLEPQIKGGFYALGTEGKLVEAQPHAVAWDTPWIHVRQSTTKHCAVWHRLLLRQVGVFPLPCLECWKVVVRPRTVKELLQLLELQEHHTDCPCKCGMEQRKYTHANYGGYFYNDSIKEGQERYAEIRSKVDQLINPGIPVILKRGCTEIELAYGPSSEWPQTIDRGFWVHPENGTQMVPAIGDCGRWLSIMDRYMDIYRSMKGTPTIVKVHKLREIFEFAYDRADATVLEFNNGKLFDLPAETYHQPLDAATEG